MKLKNIFSAILCGTLLLGSAACTDEVEYTPASQVDGQGLYLSDTGEETINIEENATNITIPVYRTTDQGVFTAQLSSSVVDKDGNAVTGVFTIPSEVTFQDGAKVADLNVAVDFSKVEALAEYTLNLKILGDQTTPYSNSECNYILSYAPWTPWYYYSTTDPGFYQQNSLWSYGYDCPVYIRYSLIDKLTVQVGVPSPFQDLDYIFYFTLNLRPEYQYNPDGQPNADAEYLDNLPEDEPVDITKLKMTYLVSSNLINSTLKPADSSSDIWFGDAYTALRQAWGYSEQEAYDFMDEIGLGRSTFNPVAGRFTINVLPYLQEVGYYIPARVGVEYLQLPGSFKSYSISLQYRGNFVTSNGTESAVIGVTRTTDVAAYAYRVIDHEVTADEAATIAQEIMSDPEAELITETGDISLQLPAEGRYGIVAVGYDSSSQAVCNAYLNFTYRSVQVTNEWEALGTCEYTDGFMNTFFIEPVGGSTWEVEVERHKTNKGMYRIVNPYAGWYQSIVIPNNLQSAFALSEENGYIVIDATDPDGVYLPYSEMGVSILAALNTQSGPVVPGALAAYSLAADAMEGEGAMTLEECKLRGWCGTLADGVVTFPAQTLLVFGLDAGSAWYANYDAKFTLDMSFVEAQVPQAAAANRPVRLNGPLNQFMKSNTQCRKVSQNKLYNQQIISHEEIPMKAVRR